MSDYNCPFCQAAVGADALTCQECGKLLPFAAAQLEEAVQAVASPEGQPITPEVLTPKLGDYLVQKGYIKEADLDQALIYQREQSEAGQPIRLGQALLWMGKLDQKQLDQAVTEQIMALHDALKRSNEQLDQRVQERTAELQNALNRLTELTSLKNDFISNISHELLTPLAHMVGYIDLMGDLSLGPLTEHQEKAVAVLKRAYKRLHSLINNLIQFTLIYQGDFSIEPIGVNLADIVEKSIARTIDSALHKQVSVKSLIPDNLPYVFADDEKLGWVFDSLIDNGIKFNNEGGEVTISAVAAGDDMLEVSISDTGIGISDDRISELFQPFHQLDTSTTRKYGGTGIGLALAYKLLRAHGSTLEVESKIGHGTCFDFKLPIEKN